MVGIRLLGDRGSSEDDRGHRQGLHQGLHLQAQQRELHPGPLLRAERGHPGDAAGVQRDREAQGPCRQARPVQVVLAQHRGGEGLPCVQ